MRNLVSICARSGSKGVPNKNILKLGNYMLIEHAILQASEIFDKEDIYFSSDSKKYCDIASNFCVNIINREADLSNDTVSKVDVIRDIYINSNKSPSRVIDLDVSSPLRTKKNIQDCLELSKKYDVVITGTHARKNPYYNLVQVRNKIPTVVKKTSFNSRQEAPKVFDMNASIYIWNPTTLFSKNPIFTSKTKLYEMDYFTAFDIDEKEDWIIVQSLYNTYKKNLGFDYLKK